MVAALTGGVDVIIAIAVNIRVREKILRALALLNFTLFPPYLSRFRYCLHLIYNTCQYWKNRFLKTKVNRNLPFFTEKFCSFKREELDSSEQ
jgi:hypothetical protein